MIEYPIAMIRCESVILLVAFCLSYSFFVLLLPAFCLLDCKFFMIAFHLLCCLIRDSIFCFIILVVAAGFIVHIFKSHLPSSDITPLHILHKKLQWYISFFPSWPLCCCCHTFYLYICYKSCTNLLLFLFS